MTMWKYQLAAKLFPWHIGLLDRINGNALVRRWIAEQRGRIPTFKHLYDFYRTAGLRSISWNSVSTRDIASGSGRK